MHLLDGVTYSLDHSPPQHEPDAPRTYFMANLLTRVPKPALSSLSQGRRGHHGTHHLPVTFSRRDPRPIGPSDGTTPGALLQVAELPVGAALAEQHDQWAKPAPRGKAAGRSSYNPFRISCGAYNHRYVMRANASALTVRLVAEFGSNSAIGNVPSTNINLILAKEPRSLSGRRPDPLRKSPI